MRGFFCFISCKKEISVHKCVSSMQVRTCRDLVANLQSYFVPSSLLSALMETETEIVSEGIENIGRKWDSWSCSPSFLPPPSPPSFPKWKTKREESWTRESGLLVQCKFSECSENTMLIIQVFSLWNFFWSCSTSKSCLLVLLQGLVWEITAVKEPTLEVC